MVAPSSAVGATVDASGVGFGGVLSGPSLPSQSFLGTFSPSQAVSSSTLREVIGYIGAVELAARSFPAQLKETSILVTGDNQGTVSCINNLRSPVPPINAEMQRLFAITSDLRCDVIARWVPRENIIEADALSREPDASDWGIHPDLFGKICKRFKVRPEIDLFGSDVHHTAPIFVSRVFTSGCSAIDAFRLDWSTICCNKTAWIFPPLRATSVVLSLIKQFATNALIVLPVSSASNEIIQLKQMKGCQLSGPFILPRSPDSLIPSLRVPKNTLNPALLGLAVYHILWL
jgi:hypothetical protein